VYGRELDGEPVNFGTTGYTNNNVFVLYDRKTDSVWYPLSNHTLDAVSGPKRGEKIEFIEKPPLMTLRKWQSKHPDTLVMLPPPQSKTVTDLEEVRDPEPR
jgi:hypothetical protein